MKLLHRTRLILALACLMAAACATAPPPAGHPAAPDTVPLALRRAAFDIVWKKVDDTFWDRALLAERDWGGVRERYLPRALAASDPAEYHRVLHEMVRELRLSHFAVVGPAAVREAWARPLRATGDAGLRLRLLDGEAVVTRLDPGGAAERAGIRLGFIIDSIDGVPVARAGAASSAPPPRGEVPAAVPAALEGPIGSPVRLAYRGAAGPARSVTFARAPRMGRFRRITLFGIRVPGIPPQYGEVEARRLAGGAGYVRFSSFLQSLRPQVVRAIRSMRDAPGLIIDLRGNPGGQDSMGRGVANLLAERRMPFIITRKRNGREVFHVQPDGPGFRGPVVLLLDGGSGSAAEQFAAGLQEMRRVTVVGERSMGRDLDATLMKLPTGGMFQYAYGEVLTPSGVVIEGRGVVPDVEVPLTREALLAGRDPQMEAAFAVIQAAAGSRR
ncbi:MAG TPA: S41 family peptidase [Longimicrobium sp.]|jgi:carboxyl-terminal processing protease|uniref:S41 family peptidase n=1 Tax=Longimicrobium sp. TaxID=2029185 RepID=UPI002ED91836